MNKSNFELATNSLDHTPEPIQYTERMQITQKDEESDNCFTPKRESLIQSYMAQAQTPISAFVPSKTEYIKTDMFSEHKKPNGTDRKTAKLDSHLDALSSTFLASQFGQDEDEPEPRRIETEIARVS